MPLISVIMPVYNVQDYVATAIESVLNQIDDLELIIVNDGSTDNSQKICEKYLFDNRVQIHAIKNSGLSVARNTGLALANGEFVYFMDSDDVLRNGFFELIHSMLLNQRCDGISFSYEETNDEDIAEALLRPVTSITRNIKRNKIEILTDLMHECVEIMAWTYIVRRSILIKEDVKYTPGVLFEDNNSAPKIFAAGNSFFLVSMDIPPYLYRQRQGSIMAKMRQKKTPSMLKDDLFVSRDAYRVYMNYVKDEAIHWYFNKLNALYLDYGLDLVNERQAIKILNDIKEESNRTYSVRKSQFTTKEKVRYFRVQNLFFDRVFRIMMGVYYGRS